MAADNFSPLVFPVGTIDSASRQPDHFLFSQSIPKNNTGEEGGRKKGHDQFSNSLILVFFLLALTAMQFFQLFSSRITVFMPFIFFKRWTTPHCQIEIIH